MNSLTQDERSKLSRAQASYLPNNALAYHMASERKINIILAVIGLIAATIFYVISLNVKTKSPADRDYILELINNLGMIAATSIAIIILAKILVNTICIKLFEYGKLYQKPVTNFLAGIINLILNIQILNILYNTITKAGKDEKIADTLRIIKYNENSNILLGTGTIKNILLSIMIILGIIIVIITINAVISLIRTLIVIPNTLRILPGLTKIDENITISNIHELDIPKIRKIYLQPKTRSESPRNETEFEKFFALYPMKNYRIVLDDGDVKGFYITNKQRDRIEEVRIKRNAEKPYIKSILQDFEKLSRKSRKKSIEVKFKNNDLNTQTMLEDNGWTVSNKTEITTTMRKQLV